MTRSLSPLFLVVYLAISAERALELALNRRNSRRLAARGATWYGENDGFALILLAQGVLFVGTFVEVAAAPWSGVKAWTWPLIGVLVLAQVLRYWCITTLGDRWNIRIVTVRDAPRIVGGPYRFFPHPNYLAVMAEAIALPLAFGAYGTLAIVGPLQAIALWRRIRIEEHALQEADRAARAG